MIELANIREMKPDMENWLIVRSYKGNVPVYAKQITDLSPVSGLFYDYREWAKQGIWNAKTFEKRYVPRFLQQMKDDAAAKTLLNRLYKESKDKDIRLICFCQDETMCHRSIVGGLLLGAGADIKCSEEYRKYWDMYKSLPRTICEADKIQDIEDRDI